MDRSNKQQRKLAQGDFTQDSDDVKLVLYNKNNDEQLYKEFSNGNSFDHREARKVKVEICVVFLKIGEIDTLKEQYEADVLIKAKWREPELDKKRGELTLPVDWKKYWNPKLFIENTIGDPKESAFQLVSYNEEGHAIVQEKRRVKGTFMETLELKDFPFDVQDLTVTVMSDRPILEIEIVDDPDDPHRVNKQSFIDEQEWLLYKCVETERREIANEFADSSIRKPALNVKCRASRRPAYFFWNIFLITFLITSLSFATFAVEKKLPQNRLQLTFTLVLTSVAFKFVVNQSLPKISYLTYLDKYVLAALILLSLVCVWHGLTSAVHFWDNELVEHIALCTFIGFYILFNVLFVIMIYCRPGKKRRLMVQKEKEYAEIVKTKLARRQQTSQNSSLNHLAMTI